jgi:hypothetical protein
MLDGQARARLRPIQAVSDQERLDRCRYLPTTGESLKLLHLGGTKLTIALALRYQLLLGPASSTSPKLSTFQYFVASNRLKLETLPWEQSSQFLPCSLFV